jgi:two-component system, OmpR family, copper resistance phosphate regulon response regulator CusR
MRVLVVEDDADLRKNLKAVLLREEYLIDTAKDGKEALQMARAKPYDLILLDILMPGIDGYTVLKSLREEGHEAAIFMVTALGSERDRLKGFDNGADDYVVKPFSIEELMARIRAAMRRMKKTAGVLEVGDLRLDVVKGQVERQGKTIPLRKKECELLEYLMCHPGEVLSQQRIARHIWGLDFGTNFNAIEAHIKNLRTKLDDGCEGSVIETLRGYGYMLKA